MTSIMDDIQDAFNKVGLFQKEVKVQTPVGTRTFYEDIDEDEEEEDEEEKRRERNLTITGTNNYAWDVPQKYDHRGNLAATYNNFKVINKENPISKPITTGNPTGDFILNRVVSKIAKPVDLGVKAFNYGYQGAGYIDNLHKAYQESNKYKSKLFDD